MYQIPLPGRTATVFFTHKSDKTYVINRFMRFTQQEKEQAAGRKMENCFIRQNEIR